MNNKGFTLTELLAVIFIVAAVALITLYSVSNTLDKSEKNISDVQKQNIENAAEIYYLKEGINEDSLELTEYESCVDLSYLIKKGYIEDTSILDAVSKEEMTGSVKITYKDNVYKYKYKESECN